MPARARRTGRCAVGGDRCDASTSSMTASSVRNGRAAVAAGAASVPERTQRTKQHRGQAECRSDDGGSRRTFRLRGNPIEVRCESAADGKLR